jgi:hypothetical protein
MNREAVFGLQPNVAEGYVGCGSMADEFPE